MKKRKRNLLKMISLLGATGFVVATPIIATSCNTSSNFDEITNDDNQKIDLTLNTNVSNVGTIDALLENSEDAINESLNTHLSSLIKNYDEIKDKLGNVQIIATLPEINETSLWGNKEYSEWSKKDGTGDVGSLEKIYYPTSSTFFTITSSNDLYKQINEKITDILKTIDSTKFQNIESAKINSDSNIYFDKNSNLLHINIDVTPKNADSGEGKTKESTITTYDLCLPASDIDVNIKDLKVTIDGTKINKIEDQTIDFTYDVGIDDTGIIPRSIEIAMNDGGELTTENIVNSLGWNKNATVLLDENTQIELNNQKISEELQLFNVEFSNPTLVTTKSKNEYNLNFDVKPVSGYCWEDGTNNTKTLSLVNVSAFKIAEITGLDESSTLSYTAYLDNANYDDVDNFIKTNIENITNQIQTTVAKNATIKYIDSSIETLTGGIEKTLKFVATANDGYQFSNGENEKEFNVKITFNKKESASLNTNISVVGSLSDLVTNIDKNISNLLNSNPDKVIKDYDTNKDKYGSLKISATNTASTDNSSWGSISYEEWNKVEEQTDEEVKTTTTLTQKMYDGQKLIVISLNDFHTKLLDALNKTNEVQTLVETTKYSIVENTAIGVDEVNDLLHVNIQEETTESEPVDAKTVQTKYDLCIPASMIQYNISGAKISVSGDKVETISDDTSSTIEFTIGSKFTTSYKNDSDIIIGKNQNSINIVPTANSTLVAMGWATYAKAPLNKISDSNNTTTPGGTTTPNSALIVVNNETISKDLGIYNATFEASKLEKNNVVEGEDITYKLTLKATLKSGFKWSDGTEGVKDIVVDNLKLFVRGAFLECETKTYDTVIEIDDLNNIEKYITDHMEEITTKIQNDLTSIPSAKIQSVSTSKSPFLFNGTIKLNVESTKTANADAEKEGEQEIETKQIKLVFDVNANKGFVFFDISNTSSYDKTKTLTVTLNFSKKTIAQE